MSINDLTIGEAKELANIFTIQSMESSHPFKVGENYLIRTVTMILVGKLKAVHNTELVLSSASWIADTGRFHEALRDGTLNEVEPFLNDVVVGRVSIIDATIWTNELPKEQM